MPRNTLWEQCGSKCVWLGKRRLDFVCLSFLGLTPANNSQGSPPSPRQQSSSESPGSGCDGLSWALYLARGSAAWAEQICKSRTQRSLGRGFEGSLSAGPRVPRDHQTTSQPVCGLQCGLSGGRGSQQSMRGRRLIRVAP